MVQPLDETARQKIEARLAHCLGATNLSVGKKITGKVRDTYVLSDKVVLVTTDRQSAFDRQLALVPYKGQVLNKVAAWWFEQTKHIIPNHVISTPHPNVTVGKKATIFQVEVVVRGYMTGSTGTSVWTHYEKGAREYCGVPLPEGMKKSEPFASPILTPTTKADDHDAPISPTEIVAQGLMSQVDWDYVSSKALELFVYGQKISQEHGMLLVDTKYEFGKLVDGTIIICDEMHTPDSSRYWVAGSYEARMAEGKEPENIDKEFLRLWFRERCDPYADAVLPEAPAELVIELASRYIQLYEVITGEKFAFDDTDPSSITAEALGVSE
ncbi:phosphoribosylamidoimidazole-succinocarboxamide synthase [Pavlovales sp. CCMP2436]|nr:phosphoribosylamidoimidazole-succinocarboxamide synthase [Pavlovales sp. CCMP2436]|mmetsp:Transcript_22440/g.52150  ORF Transcript_22440/g.52150 Transcript_22440/m.52150 type:complete len:326 (-) Transcript_22440:300-1277(-)